jgi:predicted amidohydrolase
MKEKVLVSGGHVVDPARNINAKADVCVVGDRLVEPNGAFHPDLTIKADGCLVLPGLIDYHTHVFFGATDNGCPPDMGTLPYGVTTAIDAGSAGTANYSAFHHVIANSAVRIKAFLSVSPTGQATMKLDEDHDPRRFDEEKMETLFRDYPSELLGLKLRISEEVVGDLGLSPLVKALEIADRLSCRVAVHTTNPPGDTAALADLFRPGDVFAHVFHGKGSTIIGDDGRVLPAVKKARQRGVIFDAANGKSHFAYRSAEAALADGFAPDIISSDLGWITAFKHPMVALPWVMSKYLALGMSLPAIVAACTSTPARLLGMEHEIGTLAAGSCADVAIFKLIEHHCEFFDSLGESRFGEQLLLPQATLRGGRIVFRQLNFC